jgi:hypothetical protein
LNALLKFGRQGQFHNRSILAPSIHNLLAFPTQLD